MPAAGELVQDGLHLGAILLPAEKQLFHHVAHAAAADAEHHHRIAGALPSHRLVRGLRLPLGFTVHSRLFLYLAWFVHWHASWFRTAMKRVAVFVVFCSSSTNRPYLTAARC
ncbi:hypothetical protein PVL29_015485 [Vitis rotundifolia]|uniref:Uncharacterized protein n=1 Tax=Vitis rotundifolia TaxID=103349 RepID=A0AA39DIZ7_VITRO|nr:hypothetical protein PVL29_015485 [Vitis rotundifolia]